jgi:predicted nucleic acid-binding Zn ribbon protein
MIHTHTHTHTCKTEEGKKDRVCVLSSLSNESREILEEKDREREEGGF